MRTLFARWRIDQIVRYGWKVMVPLALLSVMLVQVALVYAFPLLGVM